MSEVYLYNTLTRRKEKFVPIDSDLVRMYACGPTVYAFPQIGNWRTYTTADLLLRVLEYDGYKVRYVMNLTDVGHLTGDNRGDADSGDDRLERAARKERKTAWEVAEFYGKDFLESLRRLNLTKPTVIAKATDHIREQIDLIKTLEVKGYTYRISDGIYFDVGTYESAGGKYGEISDLDVLKAGARVESKAEKKDPRDFALWRLSPPRVRRDMEWESPWGVGFPGWHIECSAMSMKYLGEQFDIHVAGEDLRQTHHPNEIAQSEAATGKIPFVKYWIHGAFLLVNGGRMGKSLGNAFTLHDIEDRNYHPLALRYFYLTGHYRKQLNFTWEGLNAAQNALFKLYDFVSGNAEVGVGCAQYEQEFLEAVNDDLDMPKALSVIWTMIKSGYPPSAKKASLLRFDCVLGLGLSDLPAKFLRIPPEVKKLVGERELARNSGDYGRADDLRKKIEEEGFIIKDGPAGPELSRIRKTR